MTSSNNNNNNNAVAISEVQILSDMPEQGLLLVCGISELVEQLCEHFVSAVVDSSSSNSSGSSLKNGANRNVHMVDGMATDISVGPSLLRVASSTLAETS